MNIQEFIVRLSNYYDNRFETDSERCLSIIDWLKVKESVDLSALYMYIKKRHKTFPTIFDLEKRVDKEWTGTRYSLKKPLVDSTGFYISEENLERYGYYNGGRSFMNESDYFSQLMTKHIREYLDSGKVTVQMKNNLLFISLLRKDVMKRKSLNHGRVKQIEK